MRGRTIPRNRRWLSQPEPPSPRYRTPRSRAPARSPPAARRRAWQGLPSEERSLHHGEREQGVRGSDDVVEHDAEAAAVASLELTDGRRLCDVEEAEQHERRSLPGELAGHDGKHEKECDHLVPYHAAVVGDAEVAAGHLAGPQAGEEKDDDHREERRRMQRPKRPADPPAERAACGAGGEGRKPCAEAERDRVRGMREGEPERRAQRDHRCPPKWSKPPRCAIGLPFASRMLNPEPASIVPTRVSASPSSTASKSSAVRRAGGAVKTSS